MVFFTRGNSVLSLKPSNFLVTSSEMKEDGVVVGMVIILPKCGSCFFSSKLFFEIDFDGATRF
ncbi:hypothetical protein EFY79_18410 [Hanamia caeni]|jgi:hypothetical protein|uniref:Uncharacterized protein n=1 Tax=Hanamia caeni TaxID=2294116 RepID=A0A3M9N708_9BACT|nr:hypothetical protein EFY79_18410 [Hanamia caeni]